MFVLKFLVDEGLYESEEDTMRREEVLGRIDQVFSPCFGSLLFVFLFECYAN